MSENTEILSPLKEAEENVENESETDNDEYSEDEDLCGGFNEDVNSI